MANHKIQLSHDYRNVLQNDLIGVHMAQQQNELPDYPTFVDNLCKGMPTAAEELHHATTGMSGEAGELLDQSKKVWVYGKELDVAHLIEELGDLRFYYQAMLNMIGLTDKDIQVQNMVKLRQRYANGRYSDQQAIARADKQGAQRKYIGMPASVENPVDAGG